MSLQHIFMLMLENRSFDHMLGFSMINGRDAQTGQLTQVNGLMGNESNVFNGSTYLNEYRSSTSQHPLTDVTLGEALIKETYETIRNSALWNTSVLIITWDEHGGFYDHMAPPAAQFAGSGPVP
jgi:phospholipase C